MSVNSYSAHEGDVYEVLYVDGGTFEIRYGYYEDFERNTTEPVPIYPDLSKTPVYGTSGSRIVTFMQETCRHFIPVDGDGTENCCGCCRHYPKNKQMINPCTCPENMFHSKGSDEEHKNNEASDKEEK